MPTEAGRKTSMKKIYNIDNPGTFVEIPVIDEISFFDANDRYQEIVFTFSNDATGQRTVHVDKVFSTVDRSHSIDVERIDIFSVIDAAERGQESQFSVDNVTGGGSIPPHFTTHVKTHVKRYHGTGANSDAWVDTEYIDEIALFDGNDRGQESVYFLKNPPTNDPV